ncbi:NAD(P)-binding protein [Decorospora gaudefroyi]|uniref:Methylenetetrahydrofolate dehydrogenase [NAD(+)] n=1 Tax=Decorospora gaudefroyi TaxID=184978 RepID=A0A6A5K8W3_9PLEO|nr:NAD(P)-binding protein [Decorospora gaudefroyi]
MADDQPNCKVVLANNIAKSLLEEVRNGLTNIDGKPLLVGFLASPDPAARVYAEWTGKTCADNGFAFDLRQVDREQLEDRLIEANNDAAVDGIIVYYPIFGNRQDQYLQQIVAIDKDVEGLSHRYIFNMYQNIRFLDPASTKKSILPCTPLAVIKILEYLRIYNTILPYGNRLHGRTITVINRSEVVGRPLAALLANDGAHVYSVDIDDVQEFTRGVGLRKRRHEVVEKPGWTLAHCLPLSDVVISGVPGDKYKVPLDLMRPGAACINFSSDRNFTPEVKEKASIYVPAIGKVTIAVLLRNLLRLAQNKIDAAAAAAHGVEEESSADPVIPSTA